MSFLSPQRIVSFIHALFTHPAYFWALASLVVIGDAALTQLIIRFVSCKLDPRVFQSNAS